MLDIDACYAAVQARDARCDGLFFTAVKTTRIYCRPICPARTPLRRNVAFYATAALAQQHGFRPCLRCRPESAPDSPAWAGSVATVNRALRLIDEGVLVEAGVEALAERLGVTGRHLRRLFVAHLGVGPLAVEGARRLHLAKALLHQTRLPVGEVAYAAGYGSLRRFNEAFLTAFFRPPTALRRAAPDDGADERIRLTLAYRPAADGAPFDWTGRLAALARSPAARVDGEVLHVGLEEGGAISLRPGDGRTLVLELAGVPVRHLARVVARVKRAMLWSDDAPAPSALSVTPPPPASPPPRGSGRSRSAPDPSPASTSYAS